MSNSIRRIVTGHDDAGQAVIRSDQRVATNVIPSGDAAFALLWSTADVPANNNDELDGGARDVGLTLNGGSVIRIVDMLPGGVSPMHRTNSIDYGIVLSGQVELELDNGSKTVIGPGEICIQRGTIHLWRTVGDKPCRIVFVLTEAAPYLHKGKALPELQP
ncbi:MAG: cupin domain-containing protein [Congregibacter sp.]